MGAVEKGLWVPFATSVATFLLGLSIGFFSLPSVVDQAFLNSQQGLSGGSGQYPDFLEIFTRNMGAGLLLFSGVLTGGLSTLIGLTLIAAYVGATLSVAANGVGFMEAAGSIIFYAPLEFAGLLIIATAGFWPGQRAMREIFSPTLVKAGVFATYIGSLKDSMKVLFAGSAVLFLAAIVESAIIALRG